jgi:hypothetical protein
MVLTTLIEVDGPMGWVLLLAPLVALAFIAIRVVAGRDRTGPGNEPDVDPAPAPMPWPAPATRLPSPVDGRTSSGSPASAPPILPSAPAAAKQASLQSPAQPDVTSSDKPVPSATPPVSKSAALQKIAARESELLQAERRFDDGAVARISLQLARELIADGRHDEVVKSNLRRAIILASRLKDVDTHAAARLELGDIMAQENDLTTACEHWQIARQIFWDHGAKAAQAEVDQRMMANHCPTDWVLNDF